VCVCVCVCVQLYRSWIYRPALFSCSGFTECIMFPGWLVQSGCFLSYISSSSSSGGLRMDGFMRVLMWPALDWRNVMLDVLPSDEWRYSEFRLIPTCFKMQSFDFILGSLLWLTELYSVWHTFIWRPYYLIMTCLWLFAFLPFRPF